MFNMMGSVIEKRCRLTDSNFNALPFLVMAHDQLHGPIGNRYTVSEYTIPIRLPKEDAVAIQLARQTIVVNGT